MTKVTSIGTGRPTFDLPMEVLGVLHCDEAMTCHEIAAEIKGYSGERIDSAAFVAAINRLRELGYTILEHDAYDGVRYELVTGGSAA